MMSRKKEEEARCNEKENEKLKSIRKQREIIERMKNKKVALAAKKRARKG